MKTGWEYDVKKIQCLERKICNAGYISCGDASTTYTPTANSCYELISAICPNEVTEYLENIKDSCTIKTADCSVCQINKSPILNAGHICFQILRFTCDEGKP